ncbi:MAG: hypothetical protein AAF415_02425 [Pseudomonadota bacterium]
MTRGFRPWLFSLTCMTLLGLVPEPGVASPFESRAATACAIEATEHGRAACLGLLADNRLLALETRLSNITAALQGATAAGIVEFERGLYVDQTRWRREITRECGKASSSLARETCRLGAIAAREDQIDAVLARAFAPLGGVPGETAILPGEVEVFVPLGRAERGAFPFLSLDIPLTR